MDFTKPKYIKLKRAYKDAVNKGKTEFTFEGQPLLTSYAKYLLEFLGNKFGERKTYVGTGWGYSK